MSDVDAGTVMFIRDTLVVQVTPEPTDAGIRAMRESVGGALRAREVNGLAIDLGRVEVMDSYLTRCVRDLAVGARLMGVETVVCGLRPAVVETVVDMGMTLDDIHAARDLDHALDVLARTKFQRQGRR